MQLVRATNPNCAHCHIPHTLFVVHMIILMIIKMKTFVLIKLLYMSHQTIEPRLLIVFEHIIQSLLNTCLGGPIITTQI